MRKSEYSTDRFIWLILLSVSALVFGITAVNSEGFFYPDEHYQLIEFARWKMGLNNAGDIPWELPSKIRPTLQPVATILVFKILELFGISNPFTIATSLRLLMATITMCSIAYFVRCTLPYISHSHKNAYMALSCLLWFIPYISVRYSSETMSAVFLLAAVGMLCTITRKRDGMSWQQAISVGALLGLSFEMRFQAMAAIAGLFLWYVFIYRQSWFKMFYFVTGFLVVVALSTLVDCWFYDQWVFAPLNYFRENIINGVAASFGVAPWYEYLRMIYSRPTLFIGTCMLLSLITAIISHYRNPVVWTVVFFIAGHSLVGHKELRFMFPIAYFFPLTLIWLWESIHTVRFKPLLVTLVIIFSLTNFGGLLMLSAKSVRSGRVGTLRYIYDTPQIKRVVCTYKDNLYRVSYLDFGFYKRDSLEVDDEIESYLCGNNPLTDSDSMVLTTSDTWMKQMAENAGMQIVFRSVPKWVEFLNRFYKTYDASYTYLVYQKKIKKNNNG